MGIAEQNTGIRGGTARVFFAIWPDEMAKKQLAGLLERLQVESLCDGRKIKAENMHLTLVFLGEVDSAKLETLCLVAGGIHDSKARAFDITIEEIRYWKHNRIAYASPGAVPQALMDLVDVLQNVISDAGFSFERRAYVPHITLMRKASCRGLPKVTEPIIWRAREWVLVRSEQASDGPVYIPVGRWPLV